MQQHQEVEAYYKKRWKARLEDEEKSFSASVSFEAGGVVRECPQYILCDPYDFTVEGWVECFTVEGWIECDVGFWVGRVKSIC